MAPSELTTLRLRNQRIFGTKFTTPAEVVAWLGAMQAQDYPGAEWSVGLRLGGGTEAAVAQAVADGQIVRTWLMRGTLHFVAPPDVHWMLALLTPRLLAGSGGRHRQLGLDDATFARARQVLTAALRSGGRVTLKVTAAAWARLDLEQLWRRSGTPPRLAVT